MNLHGLMLGCTNLHFFTDTLRDRHSSNTTRLSTSHKSIGAVAVFVQELSELGGLTRTSFTNDNDDYEVLDILWVLQRG